MLKTLAIVVGCGLSMLLLGTAVVSNDAAADEPKKGNISPERLAAAIASLEKLTNETLKKTGVPGIAIAIVHNDRVVYKQGFGVREAGKPEPIDADTVFQLASVSKPIATTVLAVLVSEKQIGWDDRVTDHDPGFEMYEPFVTRELRLRDLLCHRSGLPDHAGDLLEDIGYDRQQILHRLRYQPPDSSFRSHYAYTNFGFSEAGYAAAQSAGKSWEDLAQDKLFAPLGMTSTSYAFADYAKAENRALLHVRENGKWVGKYTRQPDAQAPAGGASSSLNDLTRWVRLQLNRGEIDGKRLISAEALADTHTPQMLTSFDPAQGRIGSYGLGWNVSVQRGGQAVYNHSGAFALGMRSEVSLLPEENLGIIVLSNAAPTGIPEGLTESFFDLVLDGKLQRDWVEFANRMFDEQVKQDAARLRDYSKDPEEPTAALKLNAYAGRYSNDYFGVIELAEKDDGLVLRVGPKLTEFPLRHWDRDVFVYEPSGESAIGTSGVSFTIANGNQATEVVVENLDLDGQGTFKRVK
ncbi:MAG: serine hydrolase [Planctomycetota bacterium]|nr:serine hydrolase [Planctomycetota bacterium]